jgi:hypothetical protein
MALILAKHAMMNVEIEVRVQLHFDMGKPAKPWEYLSDW